MLLIKAIFLGMLPSAILLSQPPTT
jgi:hypothetical protein